MAEAMVAYVCAAECTSIFDPAVGGGAFLRAAKTIAGEMGRSIQLLGTELDPAALEEARASGLSAADLAHVQITDFVLHPPAGPFGAIVANPPYIRHHRMPPATKVELRRLSGGLTGQALDGRAGLHVYFLLRALQLLAHGGRLAFIMPADTCEGIFAGPLWRWITAHYCLEAVVTFSPAASPFPGVDTNAIIFMIRHAAPAPQFTWARCTAPHTAELKAWVLGGMPLGAHPALVVERRDVEEGLRTGLSRPPAEELADGPVLADYARVLRGIATGANDFFFLTHPQAQHIGIPDSFLLRAIGRTRDVAGAVLTQETLLELERKGRPTWLFAPDARPLDQFPGPVRSYLQTGVQQELHKRSLIAMRKPWYKMEQRQPPPFLFAYLGRRDARFIRNLAGVVPLTGFLCVYPRQTDPASVDALWQVLQDPRTIANLAAVGKSYGQGAIKVEPRALERLPLAEAPFGEIAASQLPLF